MSTGVAVAFPRSPMITAQVAWELQELTGGRFRLGLGTQVRTHVVRRYGVEFERPGPRLRDYVRAVKACFAGFRGEPLDHHGEFYDLDFLNRQWSPGPIDVADPKVDIAAVNPWMLRMAGEVADGVHVHPIGEPGYLARHVVPERRCGSGERRSRRRTTSHDRAGDDDRRRHRRRDRTRAATPRACTLSFYGSTPNYAFIWDEAGFEGTTERIREKQKAGDVAGMAAEITDDHLAVFCTESTWDDLADALIDKYAEHGRPARALQPGLRHARAVRALRSGRPRDLRPHGELDRMTMVTSDVRVPPTSTVLVDVHRDVLRHRRASVRRHRARAAFAPLLADDTPRRRLDRSTRPSRTPCSPGAGRSKRAGRGRARRDLRERARRRARFGAHRAPGRRRRATRSRPNLPRDRVAQRPSPRGSTSGTDFVSTTRSG